MDAEYLDCDELDIECQIRKIGGNISNRLTLLKEALKKEKEKEIEKPTEPHYLASRYPKREVTTCANKIRTIHHALETYTQLLDTTDLTELRELITGIEHVSGRLKRISLTKTGPTYITAQNLLGNCDKLLACLNDLQSKQISMPDAEKSLRDLVIVTLENCEDESDNMGISNMQLDERKKIEPRHFNQPCSSAQSANGEDQPKPIPPEAITTESNTLNSQQINSIVDALISKLNLQTANIIPQNSDIPRANQPKNIEMHSSTIISPTHIQTPYKFDFTVPPPKQQMLHNHERVATNNPPHTCSDNYLKKHGRLEMHRWAVSFSGELCEIPVERFFYRVESLAVSNGVSTEFLVRNLNVLLNGKAREWYWVYMERQGNVQWQSLKCAMIHRFQDRRTDADIRQALERRKQRIKESFLDFYNEILSMSLPLKQPMTESETLGLLIRNMRPGLQANFAGKQFDDISSLVNQSIAVEDTWNRLGWIPELVYQSRRQINELGVSCDYGEGISNQDNYPELSTNYNSVCAVSFANPSMNPSNNTSRNNTLNRNQCWNCGSNAHLFKDCSIPISQRFCFGCGAKNVIKINCQTCRNSKTKVLGNSQRDVRDTGDLRSQNYSSNTPKPEVTDAVTNTDPEFYRILQRKQE